MRDGEPDLNDAVMSRAAELAMVAYDNNALDSQFLQGWLMQDRFLMRGALRRRLTNFCGPIRISRD